MGTRNDDVSSQDAAKKTVIVCGSIGRVIFWHSFRVYVSQKTQWQAQRDRVKDGEKLRCRTMMERVGAGVWPTPVLVCAALVPRQSIAWSYSSNSSTSLPTFAAPHIQLQFLCCCKFDQYIFLLTGLEMADRYSFSLTTFSPR